MALIDDLVSYYKLDGTTGDVVDSHGTNDGTNHGATRGVTGKIENAFDFDGSNDYVEISSDSSLTSSNFTYCFWFKEDSAGSGGTILEKKDVDGFSLQITSEGKIRKEIYFDGGNLGWYETSETYDDGEWHHIVYSLEGNNERMYIDGELAYSDNLEYPENLNSLSDMIFGAENDGSNNFDGKIDEVGIWSRALISDEVEALYNGGDGLSYDDFTEIYTITLQDVTGEGEIILRPDQDSYDEDTEVEVEARPTAYWEFENWEEDLSGSTNPTTITMTEDKTIGATFTYNPNFTGSRGTKAINTNFPIESGLTAGTTKQKDRVINLVYDKTNVYKKEQKGL
jgi:hypothetical protein